MSYSKESEQRVKNDNYSLKKSMAELISIISHKNINVLKSEITEDTVLENLLKCLGINQIKIPIEIKDLNERLDYSLRPSGIMKRRVELLDNWWENTTGVLFGSIKDGDPVVIENSFPWGYQFFDKTTGVNIKVNSETSKLLEGEALCFYKPLPNKKMNLTDLTVFIAKGVRKVDVVFILAVSFALSLLGMLMPFINKQIFHSVIPSGMIEDVLPVTILLTGGAIGTALFSITRNLMLMRIRDQVNTSVFSAVMLRMFALPTSFFNDYSSGELSSRVLGINKLCQILSTTVLSVALSMIFSIVYIFQMSMYAPSLIFPALLILFLMLLFTVITAIVQEKLYSQKSKITAKLSGLLFSLISGIQKIKLSGAEKRAFSKWAKLYAQEGKLTYSPPLILKINKAISGALALIGTILIYYYAGINQVSISNYIAFSISYGLITGAFISLSGVIITFADVKPLLGMIRPILEAIPEIDKNKKQVTSLIGTIEISNVTFKYSEDGPTILDDLSITINQGEYIGIVGISGSGKSTLMRLLLGFEKPNRGAIYYDKMNLEILDARTIRQRIGTCLQNGKLFVGDIFSNITITAPLGTMDDAWNAAELAGIADDIKDMPMGMHTIISEGSGGISGGQRQRILIARALIGKPKILFFDEATSALDNLTQKIVSESLDSLGCTRIVIAHRLSTIIKCDRIIVLDKGKIIESGSYSELMNKKQVFYKLAKRQIT